jgi:putative ABC transport system permease protein
MFRNYFLMAVRNMARHKLYSIINIGGLAVGLACVLFIILFVKDELSWDKWIPNSEKLWRVEVTFHVPGRADPIVTAQTTLPLAPAMRDQIPEVQSATRVARESLTLTAGDRQFPETVGAVDPNFLQVIRLPLVSGDPATVFLRPENLVISQSASRKYFGDADPIGKTLTTTRGGCGQDTGCANETVLLKVVGVMRDLPHNTQLDFDFLIPNTSPADRIGDDGRKNWLNTNNTFGYVTLLPGADPARVLAKLKPILDRSIDISALTTAKIPGSQILEPRLVPFREAHLTTDRFGGMKPSGSWTTLLGMAVIGILILLIACFNFMNLATARATMRAREISLRKCMGARRGQLVVQFLCEALLMALASLVAALALAELLLPYYSGFMGRLLTLHYLADWPLTLAMLVVTILAGLLSGIYPALILSGFRPAVTLRNNALGQSGPGRLRTLLVVLQFAVSIGLGISALVVFQQIAFARNIDLGFTRSDIIFTSTASRLSEDGVESFIQTLQRGPAILQVARTSFTPFYGNNSVLPVQRPGDAQFLSPNHISVSQDYFRLFNIKILAGRALEDGREEDNSYEEPYGNQNKNEGHNAMVNASLARALGYRPADIIGKVFIFGRSHMRVVGVAADTLSEGARSPVLQTAYVHTASNLQNIVIRIAPGHTQQAQDYVARVSRSFVPGAALSRTFLSDTYERLYKSDERQGQIFAIFVAVAIFIACLGLFGLAAFTAERRTKEIGVRKVFGARTLDLIFLMLWQFSVPVLIANVIAWPVTWYYLHGWLQGFAYRIPLSPLYFLSVGLCALFIALATVFVHALRVARKSPIHALRYE